MQAVVEHLDVKPANDVQKIAFKRLKEESLFAKDIINLVNALPKNLSGTGRDAHRRHAMEIREKAQNRRDKRRAAAIAEQVKKEAEATPAKPTDETPSESTAPTPPTEQEN